MRSTKLLKRSKMSEKLILFPFGGNTREALLCVREINQMSPAWDVVGIIDDDQSKWNKESQGFKVIGGREKLQEYPEAKVLAVNGNPDNFFNRRTIIEGLEVDPKRFITVIHPSVIVSKDAQVGYNTLIMPHVFVSCDVTIGNHCIVLPSTVISHDSKIGDGTCIGSNVSVSGNVTIGAESYIASGTTIRDGVSIGEKTLVGLGSNVISDVESGVMVCGNPAKTIEKVRI